MEPFNETDRDNRTRHLAGDENNNYFRFGRREPYIIANNIQLFGNGEFHTLASVSPGTDETGNDIVEEEIQTCEIINPREQKENSSSESSSEDEPLSIVMKKIKENNKSIVWEDQGSLFKCNQCSYGTNQMNILLRHLKTEHIHFKCNEIYSKSTNRKAENDEEVDSDEPLSNILKLCTKKDSDGVNNNDGNQPQVTFTCKECPYYTNIRHELTKHTRIHSGVKPHTCINCDRVFRSVSGLQHHIKVHYGLKKNICIFCDAAFTTPGGMKRHIKYKHTHVRPYKCTECNYAAVERFKLQRHMRSHTGQRPYQCQHCTFASYGLSQLNRHRRTHTDEKP